MSRNLAKKAKPSVKKTGERIVELEAMLLRCAGRLEDSMRVIVTEGVADEDDIEAEKEFIAEVRRVALGEKGGS
jgi:hypothetical protein